MRLGLAAAPTRERREAADDEKRRGGLGEHGDLGGEVDSFAGGTAAAVAILPVIEERYAAAQITQRDDERLEVKDIKYPAETGDMLAHFARPKGNKKLPGVIVIHENRGLNPHIEDVARRVALEGFIAIAPDVLSPLGGTPEDSSKARTMFRELDGEASIKNFVAAVKYLKTHLNT